MVDVSVLTPSYGYGRFIRDNILSVQGQEAVSVQHVIQDAESADETHDVLREFTDTVDWVAEPDEGQSDALNRALGRATGRWVAWLNADEFYLPGALRALVEKGEKKEADVVYADNVFVDDSGKMLRLLPQHRFSAQVLRLYGCFIASSSIVIRRSALGDSPWDPSLRMMMDWELYLRLLSKKAKFVNLAYPAGAFRRHEHRVTARPTSDFAHEYDRVFARYGISKRSRRWGRWLHAANKVVSGSYARQFKARSMHGQDLRWFTHGAGLDNCARLVAASYRQRATDLEAKL